MSETVSREDIDKILERINCDHEDVGDVRLSPAYSGRGMYGATCLGFTIDEGSPFAFAMVFGMVAGEVLDDPMLVAEFAGRMRSDNMGRGTILYFPGIELDDASDNDDNDEEDEDDDV